MPDIFCKPYDRTGLDFSCAFYPFRLKIFTDEIKNAIGAVGDYDLIR